MTNKLRSLILLGFVLASTAWATPSEWSIQNSGHCLKQHLREAIALNRQRRKSYSQLSGQRTEKISSKLIALDKLGLILAEPLEHYVNNNIDEMSPSLLCHVLPSFQALMKIPIALGNPVGLSAYKPLPVDEIVSRIKHDKSENNWQDLVLIAGEYEPKAPEDSRFNCFARQFLRSLKRLSELVQSGQNPSTKALWRFVDFNLIMLKNVHKLDVQAVPFQTQGLPILCAEMPEIPSF